MLRTHLSFVVFLGLAAAARAQVLFSDTFSGASINTSNWTTSTPFSDSSITVGSGIASLANGAGLLSKSTFSEPFEVEFSFAFTGTSHDSFRIVTRADAFNPVGYGVVNGVAASFRIQEDTGNLAGNIALENNGAVLATSTVPLALNTWHTARLRDDGLGLALYWATDTTPLLTAAVASTYGNHIATFNREGAGNNSQISAGSIASIDYLTITAIPETGTSALLVGALSGLGAMIVRQKLRRGTNKEIGV